MEGVSRKSGSYRGVRATRRQVLRTAALGGSALSAAALLACSGSSNNSGGSSNSGTNATSGARAVATPGAGGAASGQSSPAAAKIKEGGTYRWEFTYPIKAFVDPHFVGGTGAFMWQFAGNVAVRWDATGSKLVPELFDSWETADGMTYTVTARQGVKTHNVPLTNGRLWDAEDIAQNLMRQAGLSDPSHASSYILKGGLPGLQSAKAIDAKQAQVVFAKPTPFPAGLTNYLATFIPRENFSDPKTLNNPLAVSGTGPWIVSDFQPDQSMTFKRNPDFWGGGPPHIESVVLRQSGDRVSQMSSFIQKNASYLENPSKVERDTVASQLKGAQLFDWPGSTAAFTMFNVKKPPFDDARVRMAMHLATNYVQNEDAYWGTGFWAPIAVLNNAFADAIQPDDVLKLPGWRTDKSADLKTANDLLTAAGFPGGQGLKFQYTTSDVPVLKAYGGDFAVRQLDNWKQAFPKIDVSLQLAADSAALTTQQRAGNFQVTHYSVVAASPASLELAQNTTTQGINNVMGYSNPQLDDLLTKATTSLDASTVTGLLKQAQDILLKDLPLAGMHRLYQAGIFAPFVRNFPTIPGGTKPLAGNFENWNSDQRFTAVMWLDL